jgi:hypothetical protein
MNGGRSAQKGGFRLRRRGVVAGHVQQAPGAAGLTAAEGAPRHWAALLLIAASYRSHAYQNLYVDVFGVIVSSLPLHTSIDESRTVLCLAVLMSAVCIFLRTMSIKCSSRTRNKHACITLPQ